MPKGVRSRVRSRLGGLPQLPDGMDWPVGESYGEAAPMHFLAQIDCAELPGVDPDMPSQGMLFFFAMNDDFSLLCIDLLNERFGECGVCRRDRLRFRPPCIMGVELYIVDSIVGWG